MIDKRAARGMKQLFACGAEWFDWWLYELEQSAVCHGELDMWNS